MLVLVGAVTSHRFIWPSSVRCGIRAASSVAQAAILGRLAHLVTGNGKSTLQIQRFTMLHNT